MSNGTQRASKTIHALKTPYREPSWPSVTAQLEASILDLTLPLLEPIGQYRERHGTQSKNKSRNKKKKKRSASLNEESERVGRTPTTGVANEEPAIHPYVTIGFNSTVRQLEMLSRNYNSGFKRDQGDGNRLLVPFAILVCTSTLPPIVAAPLPILARTAAIASQTAGGIRLIPISQRGADRISATLKQPRANVVGILQGAPDSLSLQALVEENIEPMNVPWLRNSADHVYQPVQVQSEQTKISKEKQRKRKRDPADEVGHA